jgi:hypothetical protein
MGWAIEKSWIDSCEEEQFIFFSAFTQPPIQCVAVTLSPGIKRLQREAGYSPSLNAKVKECVKLYF